LPSGLVTYQRLQKMSKRALNAVEESHSQSRERFNGAINELMATLSRREDDYSDAKQRAIEQRTNSIDKAIAEALEAKMIRCEILGLRSSLSLLRANEFYHNALVTMARDARLGIEYDHSKLDSLLPKELREPIMDAMRGLDMPGMLDPLIDEMTEEDGA